MGGTAEPAEPNEPNEPNDPELSVIMPVGGVDELLDHQLRRLAVQDPGVPWELILSLNSPDPAARRALDAAVAAVPVIRSRVIDSSAVRSASHARNAGAAESSAGWLVFCDADDEVANGWLAAMSAALRQHRAVGGHLEERRLSVPGQDHWRPEATPGDLPSYLGHRYPVSANVGVQRSVFDAVGGFREDLTRCEDIAFGWDLARQGVHLHYEPAAVVSYRHRKGFVAMLRQHYLYGIGMAEVLARCPEPGDAGSGRGVGGVLRSNNQPVAHRGIAHYSRRGAIAAGRLVGLVAERRPSRRNIAGSASTPTSP